MRDRCSVVGFSSNRLFPPLTVARLHSAPSLHGHYPLLRYYGLSDSRKKKFRGSPRFLGSSIPTRRLQPPRKVRWLLHPLLDHRCQASSASTDWPLSKGLTRLNRVRLSCGSRVCLARLRDVDYSGSSRLRGYVDERVISTVNSFQFTR